MHSDLLSGSEEQTFDFARRLAESLTLPAHILLFGDLGAGKTTFTKGLASGFGVEDVDAAYESLTQKDVRFVMPPTTEQQEGIRLAVLLDPDGFSISLVQTVGRAGGKAPDAS